jgi:hypothetical protein
MDYGRYCTNSPVSASGIKSIGGSVWLGHSAPQRSWGTLHSHAVALAQFVGPGNATHFLIRAAKPSRTARTLCEIAAKKFLKKIYKDG